VLLNIRVVLSSNPKRLEFITIRPSKLPQTAPVFFVGKKNEKKYIV